MKRAFSMPAALLGLGAALSAYASTADLWLSFAVYLGLLSLNLAAHGAGAGRGGSRAASRQFHPRRVGQGRRA